MEGSRAAVAGCGRTVNAERVGILNGAEQEQQTMRWRCKLSPDLNMKTCWCKMAKTSVCLASLPVDDQGVLLKCFFFKRKRKFK